MTKRVFDLILSSIGLFLTSPILIIIGFIIIVDSRGGIFFRQVRVGRDNKDFKVFKFRTMKTGSDKKGLITVGAKDSRITTIGYYLRKYKLDELPQLLNVFFGDMSFVGPRPEIRNYVDLYNQEQLKVLSVRPGITDRASIYYSKENELLARSEDPHKTYLEEIMPHKLQLNLDYINNQSFVEDIRIIKQTIFKIIRG